MPALWIVANPRWRTPGGSRFLPNSLNIAHDPDLHLAHSFIRQSYTVHRPHCVAVLRVSAVAICRLAFVMAALLSRLSFDNAWV